MTSAATMVSRLREKDQGFGGGRREPSAVLNVSTSHTSRFDTTTSDMVASSWPVWSRYLLWRD
jgi:hypothetical protein